MAIHQNPNLAGTSTSEIAESVVSEGGQSKVTVTDENIHMVFPRVFGVLTMKGIITI